MNPKHCLLGSQSGRPSADERPTGIALIRQLEDEHKVWISLFLDLIAEEVLRIEYLLRPALYACASPEHVDAGTPGKLAI